MKGQILTNGAQPCANPECRTTGGYADPRHTKPVRVRGLCKHCYNHAYKANTFARYPKLGREYVAAPDHPTTPPPTFDLGALVPRIRLPWGAPQAPEWQRIEAYNERRATDWLAAREQRAA